MQAYAALAFLTLSIFLLVWLPAIRQAGDLAGMGLMGGGVTVYITELWRDTEGRGAMLGGALDGPQVAAIALVVVGALLMLERKGRFDRHAVPRFRDELQEAGSSTPVAAATSAPVKRAGWASWFPTHSPEKSRMDGAREHFVGGGDSGGFISRRNSSGESGSSE